MNLRIKERRELAGMTQRELAQKVGKSFRTIQSWERCESYPNAEYVMVLSKIFGTDPNDLLGWYDEHPEDRPASPPADPMASDLVRHFSNLSEEGREVAVNVLAGMESTYPQGDGSPGVVEEAV